jgi:hypothetical protein
VHIRDYADKKTFAGTGVVDDVRVQQVHLLKQEIKHNMFFDILQ